MVGPTRPAKISPGLEHRLVSVLRVVAAVVDHGDIQRLRLASKVIEQSVCQRMLAVHRDDDEDAAAFQPATGLMLRPFPADASAVCAAQRRGFSITSVRPNADSIVVNDPSPDSDAARRRRAEIGEGPLRNYVARGAIVNSLYLVFLNALTIVQGLSRRAPLGGCGVWPLGFAADHLRDADLPGLGRSQ